MGMGCDIKAAEGDSKDMGEQGPMDGDGRSGTQAPALKPVPYRVSWKEQVGVAPGVLATETGNDQAG